MRAGAGQGSGLQAQGALDGWARTSGLHQPRQEAGNRARRGEIRPLDVPALLGSGATAPLL
jgi:hypothetical protein